MREHTLGKVKHPEFLRLAPWDTDVRELVEDPVADKIAKGDPIFGWEGDDRLALYINRTLGEWQLVRLESDGQYRITTTVPGIRRGFDVVAGLVLWLVESDVRRGFNPHLAIVEHQVKKERAKEAATDEFEQEAAERVVHGLIKDGALR